MTVALRDDYLAPGEWTTDDLDRLPDDGRRRELLDGQLIVSPSLTRLHQSIAMLLGAALQETCPAEFDVTQGVSVRTSRTRSLIPDLLVTELDAAARNPSSYLPNEVLLAVEIASRTSDGILLADPWDMDTPLARITPRSR
ncbi:Uma2 family endonuclease [Verrucosispora sp. WMMD1129]|uniref:Uma2 family endonuclease n=1 Tax=Verrucosispora sp. WMMD1129 TaxID=3016093 RepID=UPI00249CB1BE|nr:Uma2 family endonuclease [Verrucosispora sp. WMMD1129]WFE46344.1 Uma2 family endonuclease [Verrucosispora sp. WMMD1129]